MDYSTLAILKYHASKIAISSCFIHQVIIKIPVRINNHHSIFLNRELGLAATESLRTSDLPLYAIASNDITNPAL